MKNIVYIGKNPFYKEILDYTLSLSNARISGVFLEQEKDAAIQKWLTNEGIDGYPLDILNDSEKSLAIIRDIKPDWLINYNAIIILKPELLKAIKFGSLNMHPGLLPAYAGLHTHQWAIRNGEKEFGSTLHWMEPKVDAGDIVFQDKFTLNGEETGLSLYLKCLRSGKEMIQRALDLINEDRSLPRITQNLDHRKVYLNRDAQNGTINWNLSSDTILRFFRAADYGFFESPTYEPVTKYNGTELLLHKAKLGSKTAAEPGTILSYKDGTIEVACGNNQSIYVKIKDPGNNRLKVGESLSSFTPNTSA